MSWDDDEVSDDTLLSGMAVGDDRAGLVFVRRCQRRLFGLAIGIVGGVGDAEDVARARTALAEERLLTSGGRYADYRDEVRWRVLPGVW